MIVSLRVTLGILLVVASRCNVNQAARFSREVPPPPLPPPFTQNATEINNRDLNKILTDIPKTEIETKIKPTNNVHSLEEFPLRFGKIEEEIRADIGSREDAKDHDRYSFKDKSSRAIDLDNSKFWSKKNHVFTIPPVPDIDKYHDTEEEDPFDSTYHSNFFSKYELTTPKTEIFDKKYKETVETVDQKIDEGYREEKQPQDSELEEDEIDDEDVSFKTNNTDDYIQIKSIVKNETADKNSIHKDLEFEHIKQINYDNSFGETVSYEETTKVEMEPSITQKTSQVDNFTRKPSLVKDSITEKSNNQILSNKIETETKEPLKVTSTSVSSISKHFKDDTEVSDSISKFTVVEATTPSDILKANISERENHIIPVEFITSKPTENPESSSMSEISSPASSELPNVTEVTEFSKNLHNVTTRLAIYNSTTEETMTTELSTISDNSITTIFPEDRTEEITTEQITESTTETVEITTTEQEETTQFETTEITQRTSKSLQTSVAVDHTKTSERSVESTTRYTDIVTDSTTIEDITKLADYTDGTTLSIITEPIETTTEDRDIQGTSTIEMTTLPPAEPTTKMSVQQNVTSDEASTVTSTEYTFIHIEDSGFNQTTLHPETLGPSLNYSTPGVSQAKPKNVDPNVPREFETTTIGYGNISNTEEATEGYLEVGLAKDEGGNQGKIAAIVISSVGAACVVLLAGLLYVMRKRQNRLNYGPRCRPVSLDDYSIDNLSVYNSVRRKADRMSKRSFGNPAFDDPTSPTHPLNFPALAKFSTNFDDIRAEYEDIPQISARTSELPEGCDSKNRYANVIPLPETRVFLKTIDGYDNSDYINANYVTGPKNVRGYYIATQGPLENTIDDFWRMIWEQQVKVLLMLTHLVENGLEKCVDYLPESEVVNCSRSFGDFQIILKRREVKDKYIISCVQLKNMVSNSWREITHFWYLGWPEKGVPGEANSLIAFLIEARSYMKTITLDTRNGANGVQSDKNGEHNPVVIHCSPGTGRTGVAIACDIAIREFENSRLVDIPKIVYKIRRDRAGAVQTKEQYQFIYKVVSLYATKLTGGALENF